MAIFRKILFIIILVNIFIIDAQALDRTTLRWIHKKPSIDSIVIEGNHYFSDAKIRSQMYSKVRNFWHFLKRDRHSQLQSETLSRDTLEIKYLYLINGFLGVQVHESFEVLDKDSAALVRVKINEGRQYRYGVKKVTGNYEKRFDKNFYKITKKLRNKKPVNIFELHKAVFDMKTIIANHGYPYAKISYEIDTISTPPIVPITFNVNSDSLVYFGRVSIVGLRSYPDYVARRELKIRSGKLYQRQMILDSQRRLFEAGYFSYLQLNQIPDSNSRLKPDFILRVKERKPKYISVATGVAQSDYSDLQWDFSFGFGKRNFFGSRKLNLLSDYSFNVGHNSRLIANRYRLRYTEPWFLNVRMPFIFTAEYDPPVRSQLQDFKLSSFSLSVSTTKRIGNEIRTTGGLEYVKVKISGVPLEKADSLRRVEGISVRRKLYYTFRLDSRDDIFIPRKGFLTDISTEYFGGFLGGDDSFYKLLMSLSTYHTIWPGWISATRIKTGWTKEFGNSTEVPKEELFYLGGANSIRGFKENSLGPLREDGSAEGANFIFIFNQEFRWRTVQLLQIFPFLKTFPLWQSAFFDMGNGFRYASDISFNSMAYSYGTGVQIVSPAGPIRIDYARRIKTKRYNFASRWHFTILYAF